MGVGVDIGVEHRRGEPSADPPRRGDLAPEALAEFGVDHVRADDLDRDGAPARVPPQVDPAHAARAQHAEQPIVPDPRRIARTERLHRAAGSLRMASTIRKARLLIGPAGVRIARCRR